MANRLTGRAPRPRRKDPGTRLRDRALYPDRPVHAENGLPQEPNRRYPGAGHPVVERREGVNMAAAVSGPNGTPGGDERVQGSST